MCVAWTTEYFCSVHCLHSTLMVCRGFRRSSPGCATCPSTTTPTGSCWRCSTIPCRTSWPPRNTWTTVPLRWQLSSRWSSGTGCWPTCPWEGWRPEAASTSLHLPVRAVTEAWAPGGCKVGCVGKFVLYCAVKRWNSFFTFLSFSTKFKAQTNTEQQESVASIRDKVCCKFSVTTSQRLRV